MSAELFAKLKVEQEKKKSSLQSAGKSTETPAVPNEATPLKEPIEILSVPSPTQLLPTEKSGSGLGEESIGLVTSSPTSPSPPIQEPKITVKKYDGTPITEEEGTGIIIYGGKGDGKTVLAFSPILEDKNVKIACLSFDLQSNRIKKNIYNDNPNIQVWDPTRYYSKFTDSEHLSTAEDSFCYWKYLLTEGEIKQFKPDYIVVDALEIFKEITEMKMRSINGLQPHELFANWGFWNQRSDFMDDIDIIMKRLAKKAVIYTSYIKLTPVKNKNTGEETLVEPKWAGNTKTKTVIVIKVDSITTANGREFYATVESSKISTIPTSGRKLVGSVDNNGKIDIRGFKALGKL